MKSTITFADVTTSDFLAYIAAGNIDGNSSAAHTFTDPYATITSVGPYSDGVNSFIRIHFTDEWGADRVATRFPTETLIVSDVSTDPDIPTVTGVATVITYSDSTTATYEGTLVE
jgi:hypothetical protein